MQASAAVFVSDCFRTLCSERQQGSRAACRGSCVQRGSAALVASLQLGASPHELGDQLAHLCGGRCPWRKGGNEVKKRASGQSI
eukprot:CAMPEP_0115723890 /NCGR_PEP_ID=MMETSP0272-20121206/80487_1 /TAXON_ID=71861 /ORGANISM="Scrippsiella trochoidea, Strain CCMP3099" /LENGTH=83 /DNA_ID=CAMNT_0003167079 /DNA_START=225 /DNA_END=476 /DNA_ORIENTATION=-